MSGAGRSCLFSQREKIEMRGRLATTTGYRSPPPSRSTPVTQRSPPGSLRDWGRGGGVLPPLPLGEGWGEGGGRRGPRDPAKARPPSYAKVSTWNRGGCSGGVARTPPERGPGQDGPAGRGSYPLSRWERVGVRAGGGGGRATLLKATLRQAPSALSRDLLGVAPFKPAARAGPCGEVGRRLVRPCTWPRLRPSGDPGLLSARLREGRGGGLTPSPAGRGLG